MYLVGFVFVFGITLLMCLAVAIIEWVIAQVGAVFFAVILAITSVLFLIVKGERKNEE